MVQAALFFIFVFLSSISSASATNTGNSSPTLTADQLEYGKALGEFVATGKARLEQPGMMLEADIIRYNKKSGRVQAEGKAVYSDNDAVLRADTIQVNLETKLGSASGDVELFYIKENLRITGSKLQRLSKSDYHLMGCSITTCDGDRPAWSLRVSSADFRLGQSISGTNVRFKVGPVPMFYSPYFWAPALVEKQSGFLFPDFGYSSNLGAVLKLKYYWMISENRDATLQADIFSKRGLGKGLEYRYLEENSKGDAWLYHINDQQTGQEFLEFKLGHDQEFGENLKGFLRINTVSGKDFYREFIPSQEEKIQRYLEDTGHISWRKNMLRLFATGRILQNLEPKAMNIATTSEVGGRLFSSLSDLPLYLSIDGSLDQFTRSDGPEGQRLHMTPTLVGAIKLPYVTLNSFVRYRKAIYRLSPDQKQSIDKDTLTFKAKFASKLYRSYGITGHYIEPELTHSYVTAGGGRNLPSFDFIDVADEKNLTSLRLINRLYRNGGEVFRINFSEGYDFLDDKTPWTNLASDLVINGPLRFSASSSYNIYDTSLDSANTDLRFKWSASGHLAVGYRYVRNRADTYLLETAYRPWQALDLLGKLWYDARGGGLREFQFRGAYTKQCWGISLNFIERPEESKIMAGISLKGLGSFGNAL